MAFIIWTWLAAHGCKSLCSAALLANATVEVGNKLDPCTQSTYAGLFQWGGSRKTRLFRTYGRAWCKVENQLTYMVTEMREMGMWHPLTTARTQKAAAAIVARFEGGAGAADRAELAAAYNRVIQARVRSAIVYEWGSKHD